MPRTSTSALLKTQKSRQNEIWRQEDSLKDYEWTLSDKSPEAYAAYAQHYKNRMNSPQADGDKMLTYQKRLTSANKSYVSNEIQRASIDIIEGRQPEEYKIQVLEQMYTQAYQLGDMDLAQSLRYQLDNQYVQQQNRQLLEMAAYGRGGGGGYGGSGGSSGDPWKDYIEQIDDAKEKLRNGDVPILGALLGNDGQPLTVNKVNEFMEANGIDGASKLIKQYFRNDEEFNQAYGKDADMFDVIYGTLGAEYEALKESILQIDEPNAQKLAMADLNKQMEKDTVVIGGKKLSLADLYEGIALTNENPKNSPFAEVVKDGKKQLAYKSTAGYFWQWDENGDFVELPKYDGSVDSTGLRKRFGEMTDEASAKNYKTGDTYQYAINPDTGKFELVDANTLKRNDEGKLQRGSFQVDRGQSNAKGFDWKSAAIAAYMAPMGAIGAIASGAGVVNSVRGLFGGGRKTVNNVSVKQLAEAAGLKETEIEGKKYFILSDSAKKDLINRGITDFSNVNEEELARTGGTFTRTDQNGNIRIIAIDQRTEAVNGKDPVFGLTEQVGYNNDMLRNELVDQPNASRELMRSQLNVGGSLQGGIGDLNSISGILATNQQKIRLDQQRAAEEARQNAIRLQQQEAQRVAMLQANVSIPGYSPPAPIRVTPRSTIQPAAPARVLQPAAPARVVQPAVNPQPVGGYAGAGNQLTYNGNLSVRNVTPQYNLRVR